MKLIAIYNKLTEKIARITTRLFAPKQEIHYINGPETLPAPLEPEEEQ